MLRSTIEIVPDQPATDGTLAVGESSITIRLPLKGFLRAEPRADGYQPLMASLWAWQHRLNQLTQSRLHPDTFRHLWNVARRLDVAHHQFELVRAAIDRAHEELDPRACRHQMFVALGHTELAIIALSRALQLTLDIPRRFRALRVPVPTIVKKRANAVRALRRACEHLEEDELQRPLVEDDNQLIAVFRALHLFEERRVVGEAHSLDIGAEATALLVQAREYLVEVVTRLPETTSPSPPGPSPAR